MLKSDLLFAVNLINEDQKKYVKLILEYTFKT